MATVTQSTSDPQGQARKLARVLQGAGIEPTLYLVPEAATVAFAVEDGAQLQALQQRASAFPAGFAPAEGENRVTYRKQ